MINIQSLTFSYKPGRPLFENLNLQLQPGHIYGLLGKNGAGKSTLLKQITGLLFPDAGKVEVFGEVASERNPSFLQDIFLVPEELYLPKVKIKQYLATRACFYPNFDHKAFAAYLKEFDIPQHQYLPEMSYGQKKKFVISFALAANTRVLVMDEPTNGLDIPSKSIFRKLIAGTLTDDKCIIISTHQVRDLDNLIDSIVIIDNHRIIFREAVETVTDKLSFKVVPQLNPAETVLYADSNLRGHAIVTPNQHQEHSRIDMELLFNAVLSNRQSIQEIFN
ncbi:ABC-2 type transport system ATP-binding protein [Chitinophaga jiangningensis]|uniref:ABC-2 type transport system ATP-binding protein n=1 Tax=Chitinophaga jiangningensis TaxID=1419482 RepID=A0A1M6WXD9_9BACT|nr:ABC transporter ATP-binding protein [Chitinophaga jiangningensis]SHK98311.1 ABC-2 type transport system ATP-binding protein [Chitinophaga jiangningensis]